MFSNMNVFDSIARRRQKQTDEESIRQDFVRRFDESIRSQTGSLTSSYTSTASDSWIKDKWLQALPDV